MRTILVVALLAGCGSAHKPPESLVDSVREYNEGMRWQRFEVAAVHLPPTERGTFVDEMDEQARDLKITDYEVIQVETPAPKEAKVQVKVSWYLDNEGTLKETHAMQTWEQHGKQWWMVEASRVRGDEMPGLTERVERATPGKSPM